MAWNVNATSSFFPSALARSTSKPCGRPVFGFGNRIGLKSLRRLSGLSLEAAKRSTKPTVSLVVPGASRVIGGPEETNSASPDVGAGGRCRPDQLSSGDRVAGRPRDLDLEARTLQPRDDVGHGGAAGAGNRHRGLGPKHQSSQEQHGEQGGGNEPPAGERPPGRRALLALHSRGLGWRRLSRRHGQLRRRPGRRAGDARDVLGRRLGMHLDKGPVQHGEEPAGVSVEARGAELEGLAARQPDEAGRQLFRGWHPCAANQDGDDPHVARQGRLDLQANKVVRVVEAPLPILVGDGQPSITDEDEQHVAGANGVGDHLGEVFTRLDRVHVFEDLVPAELRNKVVVEPAGGEVCFGSPVADEDPTRRWRRGSGHEPHLGPQLSSRTSMIEGANALRGSVCWIVLNNTGTECSAAQAIPCRLLDHYDPIDIIAGRDHG
jgi:hypothetical protein